MFVKAYKMDKSVLKQLQVIPGVGKSISQDLYAMGIRQVSDLKEKDPEEMYAELCDMQGPVRGREGSTRASTSNGVDRCMLYVFRCAVYFASTAKHDPKKLDWWYWKDKE